MKSCNFSQPRFMKLMMMGLLLGACLGMGRMACGQTGPVNLLANTDFAKGMEGWTCTSWGRKGVASIDEAERYDGKPTLKVVNSVVEDTQVNQKVTLKPHTRYKLSGMIKTKDVEPSNRKSKQGAALCVHEGERSPSHLHSITWTRVHVEIDSGSRTVVDLGPRLGHNSAMVTGTAWYADLSLVELGPGK